MDSMSTGLGVGAAIGNAISQRVTRARVKHNNETMRGLRKIGPVSTSKLGSWGTSLSLFCADNLLRSRIVEDRIINLLSNNSSVLVVHAGDAQLVTNLNNKLQNQSMIIADGTNCCYEPLAGLDAKDVGMLLFQSMTLLSDNVPAEVALYIETLAQILEVKGIDPFLRAFAACPSARLYEIIASLESKGRLSSAQGVSFRASLDASKQGQVVSKAFLNRAEKCKTFSWGSNAGKSYSVFSATKQNAPVVFCIDVGTTSFEESIALVLADAMKAINAGINLHIVIDLPLAPKCIHRVISDGLLVHGSTIATEDCARFLNDKSVLTRLLTTSDRVLVFKQGVQSANTISDYLGEYDMADVQVTNSGGNNIGRFGYHFANNNGLSFSTKREKKIKPEEICNLRDGSFFLFDQLSGSIFAGNAI